MVEYKHNHYVPEWYQKRFLPDGQSKLHYLDLSPETCTQNGHTFQRKALNWWGPRRCFAQDDLYTTTWNGLENRDIERFFFGKVDTEGRDAVNFFANYRFGDGVHDFLMPLLTYLSLQKLRTPKGLGWLRQTTGGRTRANTLIDMQRIQNIFGAIWAECIWQIADASKSPTKFIISDHPVVVYNRECFPASKHCKGYNDPDIRNAASHTYFPLSADKILILTNLSWVRNPYQNPLRMRPNPKYFRNTIFKAQNIQIERMLTEEEVLEINYITKLRAHRYISASSEAWLYPERHLDSTHWRKMGDGYLFMPDPRHVHGGGDVFIGYGKGRSDAFGAYGHKPSQEGFKDKIRDDREWRAMGRFKAEWARTYGPEYRGILHEIGDREPQRAMSPDYHKSVSDRDRESMTLPGEKARRRKLQRASRR